MPCYGTTRRRPEANYSPQSTGRAFVADTPVLGGWRLPIELVKWMRRRCRERCADKLRAKSLYARGPHTLPHLREVSVHWRRDHHNVRPLSSLGRISPPRFPTPRGKDAGAPGHKARATGNIKLSPTQTPSENARRHTGSAHENWCKPGDRRDTRGIHRTAAAESIQVIKFYHRAAVTGT